MVSLVGGGALAYTGLQRGDLLGIGLSVLGGSLLYRGLSGHCMAYQTLGVNTASRHSRVASVPAGEGVKVVRAVTINRSPHELYTFWRQFDNLPNFMEHLVSVRSEGKRSHWVARAPVGMSVSWDAEIINDQPDRLIAWRSLEGSQIDTAGSVTFAPAAGNRGTTVTVTLKYDPPGGKLGSYLAWLFGEEPSLQISTDLHRFQQLMEAGEIATARMY
jgi:uncharacterized membrane protein